MVERSEEVRLRAIGEGIHVLSVLGFPPLPTHLEHWLWNLTYADLSNIESGNPQPANNNFSS